MTRSVVRLGVLVGVVCLLMLPALAQGEGGEGGAARAAPSAQSFASVFFYSAHTDARTGERSIELLGSMIIWFLLALSMVSIGLIGHMALTNQRKAIVPDGVVEEVTRHLKEGRFKDAIALTARDASYFSTVINAGLNEASHGYSAMIRGLELASDEHTTIRLRRIEYLNVLGQVAPMIGLFGTVYGMILAFRAIVIAGGAADPIQLASGIGTALVTTFWGLIVAIPALAGYAVVRNRIDALTTEATHTAEHLLNQFRPRSRGAKPPSEPRS
ncbi:MAG: MotA/TolQ/ExbB proton channel family protein [Phycisphaeraceae bacterium]|nr:MotA/TolQ/ExbB proton channel family protein [Phycisphaerales bacterium]QOJ17327.1 MAG: MotA/TolQ/ExbB proton channel family protein [Phycisphaeraceae bacterium]